MDQPKQIDLKKPDLHLLAIRALREDANGHNVLKVLKEEVILSFLNTTRFKLRVQDVDVAIQIINTLYSYYISLGKTFEDDEMKDLQVLDSKLKQANRSIVTFFK